MTSLQSTVKPSAGSTLDVRGASVPAWPTEGNPRATLRETVETAATLAHASVATAMVAPVTVSPQGTLDRPTVLPRNSVVNGVPSLVTDTRSRFAPESVLGRGAFGEVTLVRDNDIDRKVALKHLLPEAMDPGTVSRFADEVRTLGQLDHPNIPPLHDVGLDADGRYFYVMKYIDGETLETVIERLDAGDPAYHQRYPFERRMEIFLGMLRAIQYAHAQGVLHRDIKPANVMVGRYGEVVMMDWGVCRRLDASERAGTVPTGNTLVPTERASDPSRTAAGDLVGTPWYMSPEQALGLPLDERSDVYALCVVLHEFLTLKHYLADRTTLTSAIEGAIRVEVPFASTMDHPKQSNVPAEYAHFIKHGVSKNPAERFRSVTAMIDRLEAIRNGQIPVECPVTLVKRVNQMTLKTVDRHPLMALTGIPVAIVGVVVALIWIGVSLVRSGALG